MPLYRSFLGRRQAGRLQGPPALVLLSPGFPRDEQDSTCLPALQQLVSALRQGYPGWHIVVVALQYPYPRRCYRWQGLPVISLGCRRGFYLRLRILDLWALLRRLRRRYPVKGLLTFWCTECALVSTYFGRRHGLPHYIFLMGQDARPGNRLVPLIRPAPRSLIALSPSLADTFARSHGIRPSHLIPLGVDPALFPPSGRRDIDILGAGSLIPLKRYALFVEVVRDVAARRFPLRAELCGEGQEKDRLEQQVLSLGLEASLRLQGALPHAALLRRMTRARIFLHPSAYEGCSMACMEALCAGAHVISFCPAPREGLPHWHHVHTPAEMTCRALELLADPQLDHRSVQLCSPRTSAAAVMALFGEAPADGLQFPGDR